ncbi:MAG: FAD-dependent oxidoreductase [Candidatus Odinarchaeota archaeon]
MIENCLIIGGEIAALRAAKDLAALGVPSTLVNLSKNLGEVSSLLQKDLPDNGTEEDIVQSYIVDLESDPLITILNDVRITNIVSGKYSFEIEIQHDGSAEKLTAQSVILATGFEPFKASDLSAYGYSKLDGVLTVFDLEKALQEGNPVIDEKTERVMFILCVGSRDIRANPDCSAYCCNYSINQALRIKKAFPSLEVIVNYMDIRTVANQEFLYNEARNSGVRFIRGRPSSLDAMGGKIFANFEDTLADGKQVLEADLVILAIGGMPSPDNDQFVSGFGIQLTPNKFIKVSEKPVKTSIHGIFACGSACEGVKHFQQCLAEGGAAAMAAVQFIEETKK